MSRRVLVRSLWVTIVVASVGGAIIWLAVLGPRSSENAFAAGEYAFYAYVYDPPPGTTMIAFSTCYGQKWDGYQERVRRDKDANFRDKPYLKSRASHYQRLSERYRRAAKYPWLRVEPAPPDPPDPLQRADRID